jgi:hypothetical protein
MGGGCRARSVRTRRPFEPRHAAYLNISDVKASLKACRELCDGIGGGDHVALAGVALAAARAEVVVAIADPSDADGRREGLADGERFKLRAAAERIALALDDQRRARQRG